MPLNLDTEKIKRDMRKQNLSNSEWNFQTVYETFAKFFDMSDIKKYSHRYKNYEASLTTKMLKNYPYKHDDKTVLASITIDSFGCLSVCIADISINVETTLFDFNANIKKRPETLCVSFHAEHLASFFIRRLGVA